MVESEMPDGKMVHVLCMLDNQSYRHTLGIRSTHCFSTAMMVSQMHLNVMFMCTLPVLINHDNASWP